MRGHRSLVAAGLIALLACALLAAGCGSDDSTGASSTSSSSSTGADGSASDKIDAAVASCNTASQDVQPAAVGSALGAACTTIGDSAKQALSEGGDQVDQALAQVADSCSTAVSQLPAGEAQSALTDLCDAIKSE
jgi:hypothetical protein